MQGGRQERERIARVRRSPCDRLSKIFGCSRAYGCWGAARTTALMGNASGSTSSLCLITPRHPRLLAVPLLPSARNLR